MGQFLEYLDKEWEIYEIFWDKILYSNEEPKGRDMAKHFVYSSEHQVLHPCEEYWEFYEIYHGRMPYL